MIRRNKMPLIQVKSAILEKMFGENIKNWRLKYNNDAARKQTGSFTKENLVGTHSVTWTENLSYYLSLYCVSTGIHGMRYLGERRRHIIEKLVWAIIIFIMWYFCITLILQTYNRWVTSPVIVTFATTETPIYKLPFPAVTICPQVKCDPEIFNYTDVYLRKFFERNITDEEERYFQSISLICTGHKLANELFGITNLTIRNRAVYDLRHMRPQLNPVAFTTATWLGQSYSLEELLSESLTSEGVCFSFNMLHYDNILTDAEKYLTELSLNNTKSQNWSIEGGYPANEKLDTFPRRTFISGINGGFVFDLYTNSNHLEYLCKSYFQGFKVTLHHPSELPNMDQHFLVPLDQSILVAVKPNMITVSEALKYYTPDKRGCYFDNEKPLTFFRNYTQQNCLNECLSNYTLIECGCAAFYMPKFLSSPICGAASYDCLDTSRMKYLLRNADLGTDKISDNHSECGCLPSCTSLQYEVEISQNVWNWQDGIKIFTALRGKEILEFKNMHISKLAVYYQEMQFMSTERHELYGLVDFFSNTGGLLGLFIGFSVTSAIEILYFLTLRLACNISKFGMGLWSGKPNVVDERNLHHS